MIFVHQETLNMRHERLSKAVGTVLKEEAIVKTKSALDINLKHQDCNQCSKKLKSVSELDNHTKNEHLKEK